MCLERDASAPHHALYDDQISVHGTKAGVCGAYGCLEGVGRVAEHERLDWNGLRGDVAGCCEDCGGDDKVGGE